MNGRSILIVEDEKIVAMDLTHSLRSLGHRVMRAVQSGEAALDTLQKKKPDLILMDISLAGHMNGITTAMKIHENHDIPIIYLTGHADEKTFKAAKKTAPYGYIIKPYDHRELKTTIEVALVKHQMELELKESRRQFRELFRQNFDAIILFKHPTFGITEANPAAIKLFGYSKTELKKNFPVIFAQPGFFDLFKEELANFSAEPAEVFLDRCAFKRKDGAAIICCIKANLIKIRGGDVLYCSFRDITEKIRIAEETKYLQSQLFHTNKMTSIGTLASGVAHEINNPNNFILSNAQFVEQVWNDAVKVLREHYETNGDFSLGGLTYPDVEEIVPRLLLDTIEGARRIRTITDSLRAYSRPNDMELHDDVRINDVLNFAILMLTNEIKKHTHTFSYFPGENLPLFRGHPHQVEQVFVNLIQNALHALPDPNSNVTVTSSFDPQKRCIVVRVEDEGGGIQQGMIERIADPFFTTKQDSGGTGLGLYISYSIVKQHGGTLTFDSRPLGGADPNSGADSGQGTVVTVTFPLEKKEGVEGNAEGKGNGDKK